jgi:hypothetical protein
MPPGGGVPAGVAQRAQLVPVPGLLLAGIAALEGGGRGGEPGLILPLRDDRAPLGDGGRAADGAGAGGHQDQAAHPPRPPRRVVQRDTGAGRVAEQVQRVQAQPGAQRLHVTGQPVTPVAGRIGRDLRPPGAALVGDDQLVPRGQPAQVTEVGRSRIGPPARQASGGPAPRTR